MPVLHFKSEFADQVRNGQKRQTIRQRGKGRPPSVGDMLVFETGRNTPDYRTLGKAPCTFVGLIAISPAIHDVQQPRPFGAALAWTSLDTAEVEQLAYDDGFPSRFKFFEWFQKHYPHGLSGFLIKW